MSGDPNADKPGWLPTPDPGPCPRPEGCKCTWTALDYGWTRGPRSDCKASH